ncbi:MAG: hypothetical protein N0C84_17055 [Candidatus Thiodiazotropha taylori]|uniref:Uncharacterized protein n=1 Tax=Candidatus Thiodiazotropha taylori TaxID=2792791 RepID=A0A9E4N5X5_9GAMM|nr:hypothetical protein [Candidatus Thiodiazotropha taylori]MCW4258176.1 hypothetical protein [Candidatus Thiodiazotropha taylori]
MWNQQERGVRVLSRWMVLVTGLWLSAPAFGVDVFANGKLIGDLIDWEVTYLTIRTEKGFFVRVHHNGSLRQTPQRPNDVYRGNIYYEDEGCAGQAYLGLNRLEHYPAASPGFPVVMYDAKKKQAYYTKGQPTKTYDFLSYSSISAGAASCRPNQFPGITLLPHGVELQPNDQTTTGVPDVGYVGPITIVSTKK